MSESKQAWTPGPWEWIGKDLEQGRGECKTILGTAVSCGSFCYGGSVEMTISEADKRLIKASPDLAEALRIILESVPMQSIYMALAHAALTKAGVEL